MNLNFFHFEYDYTSKEGLISFSIEDKHRVDHIVVNAPSNIKNDSVVVEIKKCKSLDISNCIFMTNSSFNVEIQSQSIWINNFKENFSDREMIFIRFSMNMLPVSRLYFLESSKISHSAYDNEAVVLKFGDKYLCDNCGIDLNGFIKTPTSSSNKLRLWDDNKAENKGQRYIRLEDVTDAYTKKGKLLLQIFITTIIGILWGVILEYKFKKLF